MPHPVLDARPWTKGELTFHCATMRASTKGHINVLSFIPDEKNMILPATLLEIIVNVPDHGRKNSRPADERARILAREIREEVDLHGGPRKWVSAMLQGTGKPVTS